MAMRLRRAPWLDDVLPVRYALELGWGCEAGCPSCPAVPQVRGEGAFGAALDQALQNLPRGLGVGLGGFPEEVLQPSRSAELRTLLLTLQKREHPLVIVTQGVSPVLEDWLLRQKSGPPVLVVMTFAEPALEGRGVPPAAERWAFLKRLKQGSARTAVLLQPWRPGADMQEVLHRVVQHGPEALLWGGLHDGEEGDASRLESQIMSRLADLDLPPRLPPETASLFLSRVDRLVYALLYAWRMEIWRGRERGAYRRAALSMQDHDEVLVERFLEQADFSRIRGAGPWIKERLMAWDTGDFHDFGRLADAVSAYWSSPGDEAVQAVEGSPP